MESSTIMAIVGAISTVISGIASSVTSIFGVQEDQTTKRQIILSQNIGEFFNFKTNSDLHTALPFVIIMLIAVFVYLERNQKL